MLEAIAALGRFLLRVAALLLGLGVALVLLLVGVVAVTLILLLSLLRGRRPELRWQVHRQRAARAFRRGFGPRPGAAGGEIVDAEIREVPERTGAPRPPLPPG